MKHIEFGNKLFDAIVCLNTELPGLDFFNKFSSIPIIAADGAAEIIFKLNIQPEYIIGDMDSLDMSFVPNYFDKTHILKIDDQEKNDFEKILLFCLNRKLINVLITGIHGGVLEHTLNNLSVYKKFNKSLQLTIFDQNRYGLLIDFSCSLDTDINEIISLAPYPCCNLTTKNLKWNLNDEDLCLGIREGSRNIATDIKIYLKLNSGELFLFFDPNLPFAPEYMPV